MSKIHFIVLAAGNGTRMKSVLPKVMHTVAGLPLIGHVLKSSRDYFKKYSTQEAEGRTCVVVGSDDSLISDFIISQDSNIIVAIQERQKGTADAVKSALQEMNSHIKPQDSIMVLFGDTPLIRPETISQVADAIKNTEILVAGMVPPDVKSYGRLVCDTSGALECIVEDKHATVDQKKITFCNSGIMAFKGGGLKNCLPNIELQKESGEYYLTDAVIVAKKAGLSVQALRVPFEDTEGINTRLELSIAEARYQKMRRKQTMLLGVTMVSPETVFFYHDTIVEKDVFLEPNVFFGSKVRVKSGATIKAYSHIEGSLIENNAVIGPFARLRPGTIVGECAKVGNFVEIKNSTLSKGAKVSHLSYVGDASIGEKANIGAGTITCNYDGFLKHRTTIGVGAFIGSNTCLIAPVTIGDNAIIGASSTISKDVDDDALALSRVPQKNFEKKAPQIRAIKKQKKSAMKVGK